MLESQDTDHSELGHRGIHCLSRTIASANVTMSEAGDLLIGAHACELVAIYLL
jgi:hypothetical protein